ncbi:glycoside hydrolase family 95 protein [Hufsiella ginkgonis]|uniref:Glycoside hydrolase family 95 protein n=1 Tax=Hufsiella ginkgonis TaxID=2695274 RepID=A0A7K1Y432_9SPHI|nr:glycoside hydrolase family 95 protein [Hufsiella ginkgonis]MXV17819.1 glycoside hydrolase family 95 protein [Hufsiella ginkgonis]
MKKILLCLLCLPLGAFCQANLKLWYDKPAKVWTEALPVGNGRLGGMIFGDAGSELIRLNEATLWSGGPVSGNVNPDAAKFLNLSREALKKEDYAAAASLAKKIQGVYSEGYLPLADLQIRQDFGTAAPQNYYRDLDISKSLATTRFTVNGTTFTREVIASFPDQVMVVRLTASKPGQLNLKISGTSQLKFSKLVKNGNELVLKGKAPARVDPNYVRYNAQPITWTDTAGCRGMRFSLHLKAVNKGGAVSADTTGITAQGATEILLFLSAATSFNGFDKCPDSQGRNEEQLATSYLTSAAGKSWTSLLNAHTKDYQHYFNRVSLNLSTDANQSRLPTNERLLAFSKGAVDPSFETLFYQYGRYLLISASRPGGPPANLQGIWNESMRPPWSSNYTININTQMNYWPAEISNLAEMQQPLFAFLKDLSVTGKVTAREFYHMNGWVAHHNSDIWALSNPVGDIGRGDPKWANWDMGAPWLTRHLYEHYEFTGDKKFLAATAYPLMKGAAEFFVDFLTEDENGFLVTAPSVSPENDFIDGNGLKGSVSVATTMDMSIIRDLFTNVIEASEALGMDEAFRKLIIAKKAKLYPLHIGKKGNLQEWYKDWEDVDPFHRHVSQLYGLHPGREISPVRTPAYGDAARKTLELRGDAGTGWSLAWKINFWARLLDGYHAYKLVRDLMRDLSVSKGGGLYPNLFDAHPPFQIDGNFGATSGFTEMLLQSHLGEIHLLPAIPANWINGSVQGLKARGNFTVAMTWNNNKLVTAKVLSGNGGICRIRSALPVNIKGVAAVSKPEGAWFVTEFQSLKGKTYELSAR